MTYYSPFDLPPHKQEALISYLQSEGLDPKDICAEGFSIHNGWISGYLWIRDVDGNPLRHHNETAKVHFTQKAMNPLPEELL